MPTEPSETVVDFWIALMRGQQTALRKIERALRRAGLPPFAWYDALWELDRAGDAGLRPFEIEQRMLLAQSNISRLVDRLEKEGYVGRRPCERDGRGQRVVITVAGRQTRKRMWPVYAEAINAAIGQRVSAAEAIGMTNGLRKLLDPKE